MMVLRRKGTCMKPDVAKGKGERGYLLRKMLPAQKEVSNWKSGRVVQKTKSRSGVLKGSTGLLGD